MKLKSSRTSAQLESLREPWRALWLENADATPFQAAEWLLPWWHHIGEGELRTLAMHQDGRLIAILPFYIYPNPASGERKLLLPGAGASDFLDGVFSPACQPGDILAALELLCREDSWEAAYIQQLRPGSPLEEALRL